MSYARRLGLVPVEKASPSAEEWADALDALAAKMEPKMAAAFRAAAAELTDDVTLQALAAAVQGGDVNAALTLLGVAPGAAPAFGALVPLIQTMAQQAGTLAQEMHSFGKATVHFDLLNPQTSAHLQTYSYNLITRLTDEVRAGIREAIGAGVSSGRGPRDIARDIRQVAHFGMTAQQARAVHNYRIELETMDKQALRAALKNQARLLRDKRFDKTLLNAIEGKAPLSKEQIDKMVNRYRERMLKHRSENIARTEALRAANIGAHNAMAQAAEANHIPAAGIIRKWVIARDERTCLSCREIPKLNPKGVGLKQPFKTPLGLVLLPPAHMLCRCTVTHRISAAAIDAAA